MPPNYKIHVIEDEFSGRIALKILLEKLLPTSVDSITFSRNIEEAKTNLSGASPDIVFLDINLNGQSSFDLVHLIPSYARIIFVTAYPDYMLNAIRLKAFDYLVKPIKEEDLANCLQRLKAETSLPGKPAYINIRHKGNITRVPQSEIIYIEGNGPYSTVYTQGESFTTARTLKKVAMELNATFIRVHKTYLVNSTFIKGHNKLKLLLTNNKSLPISRSGLKNIDSLYSS